jgi:hypothetical protein
VCQALADVIWHRVLRERHFALASSNGVDFGGKEAGMRQTGRAHGAAPESGRAVLAADMRHEVVNKRGPSAVDIIVAEVLVYVLGELQDLRKIVRAYARHVQRDPMSGCMMQGTIHWS